MCCINEITTYLGENRMKEITYNDNKYRVQFNYDRCTSVARTYAERYFDSIGEWLEVINWSKKTELYFFIHGDDGTPV